MQLSLYLIALICSSAAVFANESPSRHQEAFHVYLLIGQSNMAGRAPIAETETAPMQGVYLLNGEDKWEPASNPLNRYSTIRKDLKTMDRWHFDAASMKKLGQRYAAAMKELQK